MKYNFHPDDQWHLKNFFSRAGKATCENKHWWNIEHSFGHPKSIDFSKTSELAKVSLHKAPLQDLTDTHQHSQPELSKNRKVEI